MNVISRYVSVVVYTPERYIQEDVHDGGIHSIIQRLGRVIPVFSSLLNRDEMELLAL
jgi:hypothetical protein